MAAVRAEQLAIAFDYLRTRLSTAKREALRARNALLGAATGYLVGWYMQASSSWLWLLVLTHLTHGQRRGKAKERFTTRLPASIHARLLEAENADHRSLTDVALIAIEIYLDTLYRRAAGKRRSTSSLNARE